MAENEKQGEYTGWYKWFPTTEEWCELETSPKRLPDSLIGEVCNNQYILAYEATSDGDKLRTQYCYENGKLRKFGRSSIKYTNKVGGKSSTKVVSAKNDEQVCVIDMLHDREKTIKLLTGTWGVGKDYLMVSAALEALEHNIFDKIVWIRNNVRLADTPDLGALPGDKNEKLLDYLGPFIDHCGEAGVACMINNGQLVVEPLQSLRGRNLERCIIMCSEAENLTTSHIQLIIARAAEGSEVWFNGDIAQVDKEVFRKSRGINNLIDALQGDECFGYIQMIKSERSKTAAKADLLNKYNTDKK